MAIEHTDNEQSPERSADIETDERPQKKLRITADNGWKAREVLSKTCLTRSKSSESLLKPTKSAKLRSRKVNLAELPSLPLDILFEIFGHLDPLDVLYLARTTKEFRRVLMHRSATSVWKSARTHIPGLPPCPDDMSEPAYANLCFSMHCHNCLTINVKNVYWSTRVRYCTTCTKTCLETVNDAFKSRYGAKIPHCLHTDHVSGRRDALCSIKDREALISQLQTLNPQERSELRRKKAEEVKHHFAYAKQCVEWSDKNGRCLFPYWNALLMSPHGYSIVKKLTELGWGEEVESLPNRRTAYLHRLVHIEDHPAVKEPKLLTDRGWQKIESTMIRFMNRMKKFRLKQEHLALLQERQNIFTEFWSKYQRDNPDDGIMPTIPSLISIDLVWNILDRPPEVTVNIGTFAWLEIMLDLFLPKYHQTILLEFAKSLPDMFEGGGMEQKRSWIWSGGEAATIALAVFTCKKGLCDDLPDDPNAPPRLMYYPEYIHHRCNRIQRKKWDVLHTVGTVTLGEGYPHHCVQQERNFEKLVYNARASRTVKNVVEACGLDPEYTTPQTLDKLDPRLVCLKCSYGNLPDGERIMTVRTWRDSVAHSVNTHFGDSRVRWQEISDAEAQELRDLQKADMEAKVPSRRVWRCAHCRDKDGEPERMKLDDMIDHLEDRHNIDPNEPQEGRDYVKALDVAPQPSPSVRMKPKAIADAPGEQGKTNVSNND
ncbi:hypothetical protein HYDPIDRAFT_26881 [Hydnomerulius pinastri MD-312]|nr:hypothetical protein HYDPIDRAFT_26881 [Hydnomerulius pinastri MD-312]